MLEVYKYLTLCSSGPYPDEEWSTYSAKPLSDIAPLVSLHNYSPEPLFYDLSNLREEYKKCISGVIDTRNKIRQLRSTLPDSQKISFDEWNAWYGWYRPSNIIDGMHAALMMHMFIGEANISNVAIACHFQAVNESAIKINADSAELSAVGRMLSLMSRHVNATLLYADEFAVSTKKDNRIILTLINPSCDDTVTFRGNHIGNIVNSELYVGKTLLPLSNFENDNLNVVLSSDGFEITIPPISVALIEFEV
jgi:alpha-L-arabinofuranosidase